MFYILLIGFVSILGQVVLLRELNVAFFGIELIYIFALGIWLLGTAAGSLTGKKKFYPSITKISFMFLSWGIILIFDIGFIRSIRVLFSGVPGAYLPFGTQILAMLIAILPVSFLLGVMFRWAAILFVAGNRTLALAYSIECAGGIAGGIASTILLKFGLQNFLIALICCAIIFIITGIYSLRTGELRLKLFSLTFLIFLLSIYFNASDIDTLLTKQNHRFLVETKDTPYGRVSITFLGGQISVYENDALSFETEGTAAEEFVQLSMLQHTKPETVLVLGGGIEGIIYELSKYKLKKIDYVEINSKMIEAVKKYLPAGISESLNDKPVNIIFDDPRKFLQGCPNYDVILIGMPEPSSGQNNRYYTKEFFEQCSSRLNQGGVIAFRLRSAENLWTPQLSARNVSIYRALKSAAKYITVLPGVTNIFAASNSELENNSNELAGRLKKRKIEAKLISPEYIKYIYTNDRLSEIENILSKENAPVNTDIRPVCYQYTNAIWLSKFFPDLTKPALYEHGNGADTFNSYPSILLILFAVLFIFSKSHLAFRRVMLVAAAGFLGMVLETILILYYQVTSGILFQDIGILLTSFMAGMALGSYSVNKFYQKLSEEYLIAKRIGIILLLSLGLVNFVFSFFITKINPGLTGSLVLLTITGFLVAGLFSYASLNHVKDQRVVISSSYSADLAGACLGTFAASLFLIPVSGLASTGILLGILAILSLIFV